MDGLMLSISALFTDQNQITKILLNKRSIILLKFKHLKKKNQIPPISNENE